VAVRAIIGHSQLLLSIADRTQHQVSGLRGGSQPEPRSSEEDYVAHFLEMNRVNAEANAWFGILLPVYRDPNTPGIDPREPDAVSDPAEGRRMTRYRNRLRDAAAENHIAALEIPDLTEASWPANKDLFGERIHPNAKGHRLIAERLMEFIEAPVLRLRSK
jgi:lysophospholipase L1-like esterase